MKGLLTLVVVLLIGYFIGIKWPQLGQSVGL